MTPLSSSVFRPTCIKILAGLVVFVLALQFVSLVLCRFLFPRLQPLPVPRFNVYGTTRCLPPVSPEMITKSVKKHAVCSKYSPFSAPRTRIATVTAHFGGLEGNEHYTRAFATHLENALVHGNEVHVLCDKIIDDLWNKPAFILDLLFREMAKPQSKRLEWLVWVDRDTLILDQCRPPASFLPPRSDETPVAKWWRQYGRARSDDTNTAPPEVNLLATNDLNGLNNGIFFLRVSSWAIYLFTSILAFRHYNPTVELQFTEQPAMEFVMKDDQFKDQVQIVPQHWFNTYSGGGSNAFVQRNDTMDEGMEDLHARRGDWLIHFAGINHKDQALNEWTSMLEDMEDVWEKDTIQRDVSGEVRSFWDWKGFRR
ncbi:hypothetical protein C7974DRAFT_432834 [Boeremia exigua]|uniref:uncharacterized protein n=1 Tax=Boeremia exigua TaxID=749465 RepID=UPI001E8E9923|nr:uncharacterized protein C7974DRAFT_432834 [Boeremia exigua]KAH6638106.1 hypothetical protein C7974DRAFT_432834 [Boeremia exigua]